VRLRLRDRVLELEAGRPVLMGIVNAGPDSFSDPGRRDLDELVARAEELAGAGAALIDVGGESGRTDRPPVPESEEAARVVPLTERLAAAGVAISVDTWRAGVAGAALNAGAVLLNDVSGLSEPRLADLCAETGAGLVITHTRAAPKEKAFPTYEDVVEDVIGFLRERVAEARARGVADEQLVLDPGLDLAKTPAESIDLLRRLEALGELDRPLLLAVSRKDFVGALTERPPSERDAGTLAALEPVLDAGPAIVRVHDVAGAADFLRVRSALRGESEVPADLHLDTSLRREPA
jgi:dihydropteroate synthase